MGRPFTIPLSALVLAGILTGCSNLENVGGIDWLEYEGSNRALVLKCIDELAEAVDGRPGDYPSSAEYTDVDVLIAAQTSYEISGLLTLRYSESNEVYDWVCTVTNRAGVIRVSGVNVDPALDG